MGVILPGNFFNLRNHGLPYHQHEFPVTRIAQSVHVVHEFRHQVSIHIWLWRFSLTSWLGPYLYWRSSMFQGYENSAFDLRSHVKVPSRMSICCELDKRLYSMHPKFPVADLNAEVVFSAIALREPSRFRFCSGKCQSDRPPEGGVELSPGRWRCGICWMELARKRS